MKKNPDHKIALYSVTAARIFVGLLFIVSGLVKANDPLGLGYKMQEFFEVWNSDLSTSSFFLKNTLIQLLEWLHPHALFLSVVMIGLEIMAGIALLVGWQKKWVVSGLLILIVFFTFLTGYAFWSGKFKNCGCFGDCLPITPLTSLLKDVLLLAFIIYLVFQQKYIQPIANALTRRLLLLSFLLLTIGFQWYTLTYMPVADCLPFKKGANIAQQMKVPPGARPDSFAIRFIYEKEGKAFEFSPTTFPADLETYTFKDRIDKLIQKGNAEPAIKGFSLIGNTTADSTQPVLELAQALVLFHLHNPGNAGWKKEFEQINDWAKSKGIPVFLSTASKEEAENLVQGTSFSNLPLFTTDITAVRTAARTPLTLYYLKNGTIVNKWSNASFAKAFHYLQTNVH